MSEAFVVQSLYISHLEERVHEINKLYGVNVHFQEDSGSGISEMQWVIVNGTKKENIMGAKAYVIALCNPELKEPITFTGFPNIIFSAFDEHIKNEIQVEFNVVLTPSDGGFMECHGSHIDVTLAMSKLHYFHKLNQDADDTKDRNEALQFDQYVEKAGGSHAAELRSLSNSLKKELLQTLDRPVSPAIYGTIPPKIPKHNQPAECRPGPSSERQPSPEIINIDSSSSEEEDLIVLSSPNIIEDDDDDDEDNDDEDDDEEMERERTLTSDGHDKTDCMLPPNFVIMQWMKIHYEGTSDPADFVNKSDLLNHFRTHFDVPDHDELANKFYDKLAVRIFPLDSNYRNVKTKKTKSKQCKRRLVFLRRRNADEYEDTELAAAAIPQTMSPVKNCPFQSTQKNAIMKHWNANRKVEYEEPSKPRNDVSLVDKPVQRVAPQPVQQVAAPANRWQTVQQVAAPANRWQTVHHPPSQPQSSYRQHTWPNPVQNSSIQKRNLRQTTTKINSLARRVSEMSNEQLIKAPRPPCDPNLRHIVIDGSNVAMSHGNHHNFSCRGIALCVRFFVERGHKSITCFVPNYRLGGGGNPPSNDAFVLRQLVDIGIVKLTPSRKIAGRNVVCYDDRFIVELAGDVNGIIVSNDQYRDLMAEDPQTYRPVIERQLLQYTIVGDILMFPKDPLGLNGPSLEEYLTNPEARNGRRNPERFVRVPAPLRPHFPMPPRPRPATMNPPLLPTPSSIPTQLWTPRAPTMSAWMRPQRKAPVIFTPEQRVLAYEMLKVFPDREKDINNVISDNPMVSNIEELMNILLINDVGT